jgi:hypothetical protein
VKKGSGGWSSNAPEKENFRPQPRKRIWDKSSQKKKSRVLIFEEF